MKTTKMSLANIRGKLNRDQMKSIMSGNGSVERIVNNCKKLPSLIGNFII